jgi:hypothetical protein
VIQPPKAWDKNSFLKYVDMSNYTFSTKRQNVHQLFNYKKKDSIEPIEEHLGFIPGVPFYSI